MRCFMTPQTVEEQQHDGPEVNLAIGILRKDFGKIERALLAGAKTAKVRAHLLEGERPSLSLDTIQGVNEPLALATQSGFNAGELARLQHLLKENTEV